MNKPLSLMIFSTVLAVSLFLTACGQTEPAAGGGQASPASQNGDTSPGQPTAADGPPKEGLIALSHKSLNYYAFVAMQEAAKAKATEYGWDFESAVADFDSAKQTNQFINFINKKPLAIISDPNDSEGLVTAVNQAKQAGIPVAIFDTPTTGGDVDFTIAFDNYKAGVLAAEEIVKKLKEKYGEEKGVVLNAYGAMSSSAWRARKEGFDDTIKKYPQITYVSVPAEGDLRKTQDATLNAIAKYGKIDAAHAPSDNPAMGIYEALKQTNMLKKVGEEGHVIIVTIDAEPIALQRIKEGWYDATVNQDCVAYGEITVEMLHDYVLQGKPIPAKYQNDKYYWKEAEITVDNVGPHMVISPYVIDKSNVDDASHWGNVAWNEYNLKY
ncbi:sugar ABC transporter substrate-binding protein [Brevibacillus sp. B_LB10_24]|uniref:sugar ABC transporter substrate-binding protein n=1 Tax=Brevibacillus sp. B_LB10_24 TaxID=3380645 RepID=UPI0038B9B7AF